MHGAMSLNGTWGLTWAEGWPLVNPDHLSGERLRGRGLIEAAVPAPIHRVLIHAGLLDDPNLALNSLKARWVEEQFWIYRRTFTAGAEAASARAWLCFDRLECDAHVWLNGQAVGTHANAHRPARFDVTGKLREGENLLVVRVASGMHGFAEKPVADYTHYHMDLLTRRPWLRKAQYQCGWDWNPRLVNVGILGDARLEWSDVPRLDQVAVFAVCSDDLQRATVHVRAAIEGLSDPREVTLEAAVVGGQTVKLTSEVKPGENLLKLQMEILKPRLWWPIGCGEQHRYTVNVRLSCGDDVQEATRRTGVRRVEINQSPHPRVGRHFILTVNNRKVFCKGGNWVPPDMLYSEVTGERYRRLVDQAREANFNLLRIWGGAIFADHALCEACDEAGLLVWHDFLFACAKYPGDDPAFAAEVRREVRCAVRELAHHPSMVVWCGNNEIEWGDWAWGYDERGRTHPHYAMFHHDIPKIVREENPAAAYWFSSPYSPDFAEPNDPTVGDQNPWGVSIMAAGGADFWLYRDYVDRFPNEGGLLGASSPATLRQFLPESQRRMFSPAWEHHDNPLACTDALPGELGHAYATVELWTGRRPEDLHWEDYALASALLQAEGLCEYISNYRRRMYSSASAVFWMYNDSWPVTHGWTIVDYYGRKKLAYHPVRRAFQPITVIVASEGPRAMVYGVNETDVPFAGRLSLGVFSLAGSKTVLREKGAELPPNASTVLGEIDLAGLDATTQAPFAVLSDSAGRTVAQHRLFTERFKNLRFAEPKVELRLNKGELTLTSPVFVWGLCLDLDGELPLTDNCFDLLPGIPYRIAWPAGLPAPRIAAIGSRDVVPSTP